MNIIFKRFLLFILVLALIGCATQQAQSVSVEPAQTMMIYQNESVGVASIILNKALASFKDAYAKASHNKAFAQSASGTWGWKSSRTSIEHAKASALLACQKANQGSEAMYPCKVIHINNHWVK